MQKCKLYNPGDGAAGLGAEARFLMRHKVIQPTKSPARSAAECGALRGGSPHPIPGLRCAAPVHGRPRLAKLSIHDSKKVEIAPVHRDF